MVPRFERPLIPANPRAAGAKTAIKAAEKWDEANQAYITVIYKNLTPRYNYLLNPPPSNRIGIVGPLEVQIVCQRRPIKSSNPIEIHQLPARTRHLSGYALRQLPQMFGRLCVNWRSSQSRDRIPAACRIYQSYTIRHTVPIHQQGEQKEASGRHRCSLLQTGSSARAK